MDREKLPRFEDNPIPSVQETADFVGNAIRHARSQPNPRSCETNESHPVDEPRFALGLVELYLGPARAKTLAGDVIPQAFARAHQLGLREAMEKGS